jgi:chemotaxis family two-component system sensor kinase Cph1
VSRQLDLTACDREPIHIPGSIQPHGVMLIADRNSLEVTHAAGDVARILGADSWLGVTLGALIGDGLAARVGTLVQSNSAGAYIGQRDTSGGLFDVAAHLSTEHLIVEMEPALQPQPASATLGLLDAAGGAFERAPTLEALCERAAIEFRRLTGFDRVMIYRFLDDGAGAVLAEDRADHLPSFLHHHFPGSDIPRQARALYVRNLVRAIPDVTYEPAQLEPAWTEPAPLDMSDCALRSVSPIHMQYMRNMGVGASASVSIVRDGVLWGLIACHHGAPRLLPYDVRSACRALAGGLARQIRAKEDAQLYRERLRLRSIEEEIVAPFEQQGVTDASLANALGDLQRLLAADGVAVLRAGELTMAGSHPSEMDVRELTDWVLARKVSPIATDRLGNEFDPAARYADRAAGLAALVISADEPFVILWFRAEQLEVINWAGNPHKTVEVGADESLTPRASFEAWRETVSGRSRRWSMAEIETAGRLRTALLEARQRQRLRELNLRLAESVADKESLLQQKEVLLKEANHRIQNSLQLVSSFLTLQARELADPAMRAPLEEAGRRLHAVALVHRRLYRADQIEIIDLSRYIEELLGDMLDAMGPEWARRVSMDLSPVYVPTDRAVTLGLVLTELVINANKYAYGGAPGPIEIVLEPHAGGLKLVVADRGKGKPGKREGFGTRMMAAMVTQLQATLEQLDNSPGLRTVLTAPIHTGSTEG